VRFEIPGNTATGNTVSNINVNGGSGTGHDVQGSVSDNPAVKDSPGYLNLVPTIPVFTGGEGIVVTSGSGTKNLVHDITVSNNVVSGNARRGIVVSGGNGSDSNVIMRIKVSSNTVDGKPKKSIIPQADQDGILVSGNTSALSAQLSEILIDGNTAKNNMREGIRVSQGDPSNVVIRDYKQYSHREF
jgi:hypothetical protein